MPLLTLPHRLRAIIGCALLALTTLTSVVILADAALTPAPAAVLPLVVLVCLGCPMLAMLELRPTVVGLRRELRAVAELRRYLDRLPETQHPHGF
jgi:hypothetical protein